MGSSSLLQIGEFGGEFAVKGGSAGSKGAGVGASAVDEGECLVERAEDAVKIGSKFRSSEEASGAGSIASATEVGICVGEGAAKSEKTGGNKSGVVHDVASRYLPRLKYLGYLITFLLFCQPKTTLYFYVDKPKNS